jgi:hypothetical protein
MTADDIAIGMQTPQGQEKYVDNIMYNHDFDGDGFLTLEEFQTPIYGPRDELWAFGDTRRLQLLFISAESAHGNRRWSRITWLCAGLQRTWQHMKTAGILR